MPESELLLKLAEYGVGVISVLTILVMSVILWKMTSSWLSARSEENVVIRDLSKVISDQGVITSKHLEAIDKIDSILETLDARITQQAIDEDTRFRKTLQMMEGVTKERIGRLERMEIQSLEVPDNVMIKLEPKFKEQMDELRNIRNTFENCIDNLSKKVDEMGVNDHIQEELTSIKETLSLIVVRLESERTEKDVENNGGV